MYKKSVLAAFLALFMAVSCGKANDNKNDSKNYDSINIGVPVKGISTEEIVVEEIAPPAPAMVPYEGDLLNIFFHGLIAWPEIGFTGSMKQSFMEWYVTADEFKRILPELYAANYVLVDINEFYNVTYVDGKKKVTANKLLVPEGKKPMVLSIDDLSYYEHVRQNGSVHKLVIDEKGDIAAWTPSASGGEISYDKDIVTIIEGFIKERPDFSVRGAKGIIALTGYEGLLGYQTQLGYTGTGGRPTNIDDPVFKKEVQDVIPIISKLKELGWRFASHSWGHLNMPRVPMSWFTNDNNRWDREVKPLLGETDLYIYPFGAGLEAQEDKHKILRDRNYNVFFGVGNGFGHSERGDYIFIDRRNIDGYYFRVFKNSENMLFDIDKVIDKRYR